MDFLFALKKLLGALLMPSALVFLALVLAYIVYRKGKKAFGKGLGFLSLTLFYFLCSSPASDLLLRPLELKYPAYKGQEVDYVVVLGGTHLTSSERPLSSQLNSISLNRLTEGLMIYRANPGVKLLLSGYQGIDEVSHAATAAKVAFALGVPESDIVLAEHPRDTAEEASHWARIFEEKRVALVTSAAHMPRSVYLFEQALAKENHKTHVVPAPTDYRACIDNCLGWRSWLPRGRNLANVEAAWHEYLGLLWARLQAK